jgi:hypothetical protein
MRSSADYITTTCESEFLVHTMGCPMPSHKFHVGESVTVLPAITRNVPGGVYEVTKQLPHNGREFEYRIKSANEAHERVARESELTKA